MINFLKKGKLNSKVSSYSYDEYTTFFNTRGEHVAVTDLVKNQLFGMGCNGTITAAIYLDHDADSVKLLPIDEVCVYVDVYKYDGGKLNLVEEKSTNPINLIRDGKLSEGDIVVFTEPGDKNPLTVLMNIYDDEGVFMVGHEIDDAADNDYVNHELLEKMYQTIDRLYVENRFDPDDDCDGEECDDDMDDDLTFIPITNICEFIGEYAEGLQLAGSLIEKIRDSKKIDD